MNTNPDTYFIDGCGRCEFGGTPQCKVNTWQDELRILRKIVLDCGLAEESKWGMPCYTFQNKNVVMIGAFKEYCSLSFFKGSLLKNAKNFLSKPGENSQATRMARFTDVKEIVKSEAVLKAFIFEAIEAEKAGLKVKFKKDLDPVPEELTLKMEKMPALKTAFEALTPGRKRGYILYFSQPKQAKTRESRIEKCIPKILNGKGFNDR